MGRASTIPGVRCRGSTAAAQCRQQRAYSGSRSGSAVTLLLADYEEHDDEHNDEDEAELPVHGDSFRDGRDINAAITSATNTRTAETGGTMTNRNAPVERGGKTAR